VSAPEQFAQPVRAIPHLDRGQEVLIGVHARLACALSRPGLVRLIHVGDYRPAA
jgi:hypothetical protein